MTDMTLDELSENIESQAKLLMSYVNDLLDMAQVEEGVFNLNTMEFKLRQLIKETYLMFKRAADIQGTKLIYHIQENVPYLIIGDE